MLCALQTHCRAAGVHACTVCQVILTLQALLVTDARVEFTSDASSAQISFQVSESALCEPPDRPGRAAWSREPVNASTATYTMYQSRPMIPLQASIGQMQIDFLEQLYKHPLTLSQSQLASSMTSPPAGDQDRTANFCQKLMSGEAVTIALLGGSWTSGSGVENPDNTWAAQSFSWINTTFPHPDHAFINNSTRGATSGFVMPCLNTFVPANADLVVLEFDINDGYYKNTEREILKDMKWWEDRFESPARRAFERMLRQLMVLPNAPAIVYLHAWEGRRDHTTFYWGVEDKYDTMLAYYGLVSLSMRNSLHSMLLQQPELQTKIWPVSDGHPTCLGTRLFSDMLIAYLMDRCAHTFLTLASLSSGREQQTKRLSIIPHRHHDYLPEPLFPNNYGRHSSQCFLDSSEMQPIIKDKKGFAWTNEGRESNPRWGYVSTEPKDYIVLEFDNSEYKNFEDSMVVGVSLLTSYEHMGTLEVACYKGCTCNSSVFDACNPNMAWSEVRWAFHPVKVQTQSESCIVQLTNSLEANPSCQGQKLKIQAMLLSGEAETTGSASLGLQAHKALAL